MGNFVHHKLVETTEIDDNHIYDDAKFRVCDFEVGNTGIFLNIKCYNCHEKKKYKLARICLTDCIFQIWRRLTNEQKELIKHQIEGVINT